MYPVLRLILPQACHFVIQSKRYPRACLQKDRERSVYGMKEKNLAKAYIKIIPLGTKDSDAIRLLNWKKPTEKDVR